MLEAIEVESVQRTLTAQQINEANTQFCCDRADNLPMEKMQEIKERATKKVALSLFFSALADGDDYALYCLKENISDGRYYEAFVDENDTGWRDGTITAVTNNGSLQVNIRYTNAIWAAEQFSRGKWNMQVEPRGPRCAYLHLEENDISPSGVSKGAYGNFFSGGFGYTFYPDQGVEAGRKIFQVLMELV